MRTLFIICLGVLLWALFVVMAKALRHELKVEVKTIVRVFMAVWFVMAFLNFWMGVVQAHYPVSEELPILLIIFAIPAVLAYTRTQWLFDYLLAKDNNKTETSE